MPVFTPVSDITTTNSVINTGADSVSPSLPCSLDFKICDPPSYSDFGIRTPQFFTPQSLMNSNTRFNGWWTSATGMHPTDLIDGTFRISPSNIRGKKLQSTVSEPRLNQKNLDEKVFSYF